MAARSKARKRALDILFASELRSEDPVVALERAIRLALADAGAEVQDIGLVLASATGSPSGTPSRKRSDCGSPSG